MNNKKLQTIAAIFLIIATIITAIFCFKIAFGMVKTYDELYRILKEINGDDVKIYLDVERTDCFFKPISLPDLEFYQDLGK